MWPFNQKKYNKTVGEITYAIDHATDLISDGAQFKTVVMENGKTYRDVHVSFDTEILEVECSFRGSSEFYRLGMASTGSFVLQANINGHIITSDFLDLRSAGGEVDSKFDFRSDRLENMISDMGGNPELLRSCVTAFKSYLRNRSNGKLDGTYVKPPKKDKKENYIPTKTQGENLKTYQLERREVVKSLRDVMVDVKEHYGVSVVKRGAPKIGVIYTHEYLMSGLDEICTTNDLVKIKNKLIRKYHFETVPQAQSYYPSAVESCNGAMELLKELKTIKP